MSGDACCHDAASAGIFSTVCSVVLAGLLIYTFIKNRNHSYNHTINHTAMTKEYKISGMDCNHCRSAVEKALTALEGVTAVNVDLATGIATVEGDVTSEAVRQAVEKAGFEVG
ncbi:MAG: heavy-metal-associated domain-containing protein [Duncaniella sp.]|nr:heavy-metal-associated domain-containing protein [Duncaniella sp.]